MKRKGCQKPSDRSGMVDDFKPVSTTVAETQKHHFRGSRNHFGDDLPGLRQPGIPQVSFSSSYVLHVLQHYDSDWRVSFPCFVRPPLRPDSYTLSCLQGCYRHSLSMLSHPVNPSPAWIHSLERHGFGGCAWEHHVLQVRRGVLRSDSR